MRPRFVPLVGGALHSLEQALEEFLLSNEHWGGRIDCRPSTTWVGQPKNLKGLLANAGRFKIEAGKTNSRTENADGAFECWCEASTRQRRLLAAIWAASTGFCTTLRIDKRVRLNSQPSPLPEESALHEIKGSTVPTPL